MTTADRKRLLVALCACDRVELCLNHFQPADPRTALFRQISRYAPWLGLVTRFFRRRRAAEPARSSPLGPLLNLALGLFTRR